MKICTECKTILSNCYLCESSSKCVQCLLGSYLDIEKFICVPECPTPN